MVYYLPPHQPGWNSWGGEGIAPASTPPHLHLHISQRNGAKQGGLSRGGQTLRRKGWVMCALPISDIYYHLLVRDVADCRLDVLNEVFIQLAINCFSGSISFTSNILGP